VTRREIRVFRNFRSINLPSGRHPAEAARKAKSRSPCLRVTAVHLQPFNCAQRFLAEEVERRACPSRWESREAE